MTVAELIEELQKHPGHHVVIVNHDDGFFGEEGSSVDQSFIQDVYAGEQCSVIVDASSDH